MAFPFAYQPVIVNITGTPLASLTFEDVVTRLMNEEGRLRNIVSPTTIPSVASVASNSQDEAYIAMRVPKGKSFKSTPSKDMSKVRCHKCGGVGHYHSDCPTQDSDAANVADSDNDEEQALTAIADEIEESW
jgi:Zinc knuckle